MGLIFQYFHAMKVIDLKPPAGGRAIRLRTRNVRLAPAVSTTRYQYVRRGYEYAAGGYALP